MAKKNKKFDSAEEVESVDTEAQVVESEVTAQEANAITLDNAVNDIVVDNTEVLTAVVEEPAIENISDSKEEVVADEPASEPAPAPAPVAEVKQETPKGESKKACCKRPVKQEPKRNDIDFVYGSY